MHFLPVVKRIVGQLTLQASVVLDRQDMEQIGLLSLLDCLRRYGVPDEQFELFAARRVRGAVLDELRRLDWRPRKVRLRAHQVRDLIRNEHRRLGRELTHEEVLAVTELSDAQYQAFLIAQASETFESFDGLLHHGAEAAAPARSEPQACLLEERTLAEALGYLAERERVLLTLYYFHEMNFREISLVLDLCEARVCQLYKLAIAKAGEYMARNA